MNETRFLLRKWEKCSRQTGPVEHLHYLTANEHSLSSNGYELRSVEWVSDSHQVQLLGSVQQPCLSSDTHGYPMNGWYSMNGRYCLKRVWAFAQWVEMIFPVKTELLDLTYSGYYNLGGSYYSVRDIIGLYGEPGLGSVV